MAVDPANSLTPLSMGSSVSNTVAGDLTKILQGDPSTAPFVSWLMQGGNTDQLAGTAEGAALAALIKDPATLQAANLGIQAMNGADVTKSLESAAAKAALQSLNLNQDQSNIANVGLMAAMGSTPLGWGSEIISLGQQYLPDLFGVVGGGQPLINAERNKPQVWDLGGGKSITTYAQPNSFSNGQFTQVPPIVKDNVTGKVYKNMAAYDYTQALATADPSTPTIVTQLNALKKATGEGYDPTYYGSAIAPADYQKQVDSITAKVNDQISKMGNPSFLKGASLTDELQALYSLSDPTKYKSQLVTNASKQIAAALNNTDLTDPTRRAALIDRIKQTYGAAVPPSLGTDLQTKYAADTKAYQSKISAASPEIKAIVDKYTANGAAPPPLGSMDAVVMAKYFNAPESVVTKLAQDIPNIKDSPTAKTLAALNDYTLNNAISSLPSPAASPAPAPAATTPTPTSPAPAPAATPTPTSPAPTSASPATPTPPATPALSEAQVAQNYWDAYNLSHPAAAPAAAQPTPTAPAPAPAAQPTSSPTPEPTPQAMPAPTPQAPALSEAQVAANYWNAYYASHPQERAPDTPQGPTTQYDARGVRISSDPTEQAALNFAYDSNQQRMADAAKTQAAPVATPAQAQPAVAPTPMSDYQKLFQSVMNQTPEQIAASNAQTAQLQQSAATQRLNFLLQHTDSAQAALDATAQEGYKLSDADKALANSWSGVNATGAQVNYGSPTPMSAPTKLTSAPLPMAQSNVQLSAALPMATNPKPPA